VTEQDDTVGPIDFLILEASLDGLDGSIGRELLALVDQGVIRLYDLVVIEKDADGSVSAIELSGLPSDAVGGLATFAGARSGLVDADDIEHAAEGMEPGTVAALIVYENAWAAPFVSAARKAGANVVASARIPADVLNATLDALDAADAAS